MLLLVVLLEVILALLFMQNNMDGLRRNIVMFLAITMAAITPVLYHFEASRFDHPKFGLSFGDVLLGVFSRSTLLGVLAIALAGFGTFGLILTMGAQLGLTIYSVYLVVWKMK